MSLIRRCDICNGDINDGTEIKQVRIHEDLNIIDICPSCWVELVEAIKAKQRRREEAKEADKIFSHPWDPGMMVVQRRD